MYDETPLSKPVKAMIFIMIALVLIVFTDLFVLEGRQFIWTAKQESGITATGDLSIDVYSLKERHNQYMEYGIAMPQSLQASVNKPKPLDYEPEPRTQTALVERERDVVSIEPASGVEKEIDVAPVKNISDVLANIGDEQAIENVKVLPEDIEHVVTPEENYIWEGPDLSGRPKIAIIIDDMGVSLRSKLVEIMPAPLTLAYLPYAENLAEHTARAKKNGHELMVHMPMEPMDASNDGGPKVLSASLSDAAFRDVVDWDLSQFKGYAGFNNHMGSRLTQDEEALGRLMRHVKGRNLYFVDSKTIASSVAAQVARDNGIAYAERDIFLDHEITPDFIRKSLEQLERIAREKGYAIAIGHPHKETIDALKDWLPSLKAKGIELVPASALVNRPVEERQGGLYVVR